MEEWTRHFFGKGQREGGRGRGHYFLGSEGDAFFFFFSRRPDMSTIFLQGRSVFFFLSRFISFCDGGRRGGLQFDQPTRVSQRNTFRWTLFRGGETVGELTPFFRE